MKIKQVKLSEFRETWSQDNDSCDSNDCGQTITLSTADAGGGHFIVIETERWALDDEDVEAFCDYLKQFNKRVKELNRAFNEPGKKP